MVQNTGVSLDPRLDSKVTSGWTADELIAGDPPLVWKQKQISELKQYPIWNQYSSSACVAFSKAKQISIEVFRLTGVWIDFSPASIYQLRSNKPNLGMGIGDANSICNNQGVTLEALMKSQGLTEAQINAVPRTKVADLFAKATAEAVVNYVYPTVDIEKIAKILDKGYAVSLLIFANFDEWDAEPKIKHPNLTYADAQIQHEIVAVDRYLTQNSEKALFIEDSWGVGNGVGGRRTLTESFLMKRCIMADALLTFSFDGGGNKPSYDGTIVSVQKCLRYEGFFPVDIPYSENYGPITRAAMIKFQLKYNIEPPLGNLGFITKAKLKLF